MRIAVVSHACVIDVNQRLFDEMCRRHEEIELLMIAPRRWRASTGAVVDYSPLPDAHFASRPLPVIGSGRISLHLYRGLGPVLSDFDPDLVYLDEEPYSLPAWQVLRVCRAHGFPICFMTAQNRVKRFPWPFSASERRVLEYADLAVPPASGIEHVLRTKGFEGRVTVIPHFVDTELFRPADESSLRDELGLRGPVVGYLGRLVEDKGLSDLAAAMDILWDAGIDADLLLVGGGPMAERLRAWGRLRPDRRVIMTGPVPHSAAPQYMNCFDVLALPSRTMPNWEEQFGRVLIEAPACEVPVVGSSSGNIPNLIDELESGVVVPERDPEALAEALRGLLGDPERAARLARAARRNVERNYGLPAVAQRLYEALSEMLC